MAMLRFNLVLPGLEPQRLSDMHKAALSIEEGDLVGEFLPGAAEPC